MAQSFTIFDEVFYLSTNADVAAAVRVGAFRSGLDHFQRNGLNEGRVSVSPLYDETAYLNAYPDVAAAVRSGSFISGLQHFVNSGFEEGRTVNSTFFDEQFYLRDNPDVAAAVSLGAYRSGLDHFIQTGEKTDLRSGTSFDNTIYLDTFPDVAAAVAGGAYRSGLDHWISSGQTEEDRFAVFTGTSGNDVITGIGSTASVVGVNIDASGNPTTFGVGEVDILIGGPGSEDFYLGIVNYTSTNSTGQSLYFGNGNADYALIKNFDILSDYVVLAGVQSDYTIQVSDGNTTISRATDLIATIEGFTSPLNNLGTIGPGLFLLG